MCLFVYFYLTLFIFVKKIIIRQNNSGCCMQDNREKERSWRPSLFLYVLFYGKSRETLIQEVLT
jgi:hypothetical protein